MVIVLHSVLDSSVICFLLCSCAALFFMFYFFWLYRIPGVAWKWFPKIIWCLSNCLEFQCKILHIYV